VVALARQTEEQCAQLLRLDVDLDIVLMVGVGAANAGELVVDGTGVAFVCLEHFTSVMNPETQGLGLDPELIPLWLSHEIAHGVRYTSPTSRSEMKAIVEEMDGYYSYWETGKRATLRELLINEGTAVQVSRMISPGHASWEYYGYDRREYARIREMGPVVARSLIGNFDKAGLGLRLKYLSDGMTEMLIKSLSNLQSLDVKPRSAVFRYKGKDTDLQTIGKELNVQAVLNGHVGQRGDQLTLSLELVDVRKNRVL
jgi:hypothetical protein